MEIKEYVWWFLMLTMFVLLTYPVLNKLWFIV